MPTPPTEHSQTYKRRVALILAITGLTTVALVSFGFALWMRIVKLENQWSEYNQAAIEKTHILGNIRAAMGYGGFIHNFKNFVLRQSPSDIPRIENNRAALNDALQEFQHLDLNEPEQRALEELVVVFEEYLHKFEIAKQLVSAGQSTSQIDVQVKVDDVPALEALNYLADVVLEQSRKMEIETKSRLAGTLRFLMLGLLSIPLIFLLSGSLILLLRRVLHANVELQRSEERYRNLVSQLSSVVYRCDNDADWTMQYISDAIETITSYPASDFIGNQVRSFASIIHPDDAHSVEVAVDRALGQRRPYSIDYRIIRADGGIRWIYEKGGGIYDEDGNLLHLSGVIDDITGRRQAEEAARETERRYQQIVEEATDIVYTTDMTGHFTYVNPTTSKLTGYPEDELIGMHFTSLIHPEWREKASEFYGNQMTERKRETVLEFPVVTADGTDRWVEQTVGLICEDDQVTGFQGIVRDVSERISAEQALERNNQLLKIISDAQSQLIALGDPRKVFDEFLSGLLSLTESEYGFIGEVLQTENGDPYLKTHAITNIAWNEETRRFYEEKAPSGMEFNNLNTLFGAVMTTGESVIANEPATDSRRGGLPKGHPALNAFLGLPFYHGNDLVGMIGLTNRPAGYDKKLTEFLEPLCNTAADIVLKYRSEQKREQADIALRESEGRTRAILENAVDAIITIDENGLIESFNQATITMFGYAAGEIAGRNVSRLMPEPYTSEHDSYLKRYLATGEARIIGKSRELQGRRKDGTIFPMKLAASEVELGEKRLFIGMIHDLTEEKRLEEDRNRFFSISLDMLCIANFKGFFVQLNPAWRTVLGYTREELLAKPFIEYIHADDKEKTTQELQRLMEGGEMIGFENRFRTKNGEYRWFLWTASASRARQLLFAVARDITDIRKAAEELRAAKEAAEAASRAKSQFLASMSHELRTPLNSVIGFANVILKSKNGQLDEKRRTYLEKIHSNGLHLLELINDVLDLSKIEAGKMEVVLTKVDVGQLIRQTIDQLEVQVQEKDVKLRVRIPKNVNAIQSDDRKLKQVLINLVGNAIKFTAKGSVEVILKADSKIGTPVRINVKDSGIGIPANRLTTIFEPFSQAESGTSRKYGGTGLGLTISHSLCEMMGYRLTVDSEENVGSTFSVHFQES
ncbi:PAS domain S-box protein [Candidatus Neomarinimicrobiota bacterium]